MRENTKWIMLVTAIACVALMVFEWGMDITGQTSAGFGEIGRVNGTSISYEMYQAAYRNLVDQVSREQDAPITAAQNREIEEAAWNEIVNQVLIEQELARRGIRVTDQEIREAARYYPPPGFAQDPFFQTDGQFDIQKYQDFLATTDEITLLSLEAYYRDIIPRSKLLRQVTSGIYFTEAELWEQYRYQNEQLRLRFVALNPSDRVADGAVQVSDAEIEGYYEDHQEDFTVPAEVEVAYVTLTKAPLREDTAAARAFAQALREEILGGVDFAEVARRESSDEVSAENGGDLGMFPRGQMVPVFDSVVFSAPLNQVLEPVQSNYGFHVIEVLSRQGDSAQARHVLIPIERTGESEIQLLTLADSLEALGETMTLAEAAGILSIPVRQGNMTEIFPFLPMAGQIADGFDWAFRDGAPGEVSPVFEDQQAFYMMELLSSTPASVQTLEAARAAIDLILRTEKKVEKGLEEAQDLVQQARAAGTLESLQGQSGLEVQEVGPLPPLEFFPGLGYQNAATGVATGLEEGAISDPVVADNNVYLIELLERTPADSLAWIEQVELQRAQAVFTVQQQRLEQWIMGLREASNIVDRREEVFQASQTQSQAGQTGGLF
jgi:peptidyl-prolyl cis-trans isomerase D